MTSRAPGWLVDIPFAHRGVHWTGLPENSLAAFATAADAGWGIEFDVQLSEDGYPIVLHDVTLERMAGVPLRPGQLPLAALQQLRLSGSEYQVPTLADVLDVVGARVPLMVELKTFGRRVGRLEGAVAAILDGHDGPFCVSSFHPRSVGWFRHHRPAWLRGQASGSLADVPLPGWLRPMLRRMSWNRRNRPDFIVYELDALPHPAVSRARAAGAVVVAWTVRSPSELEHAREHADNVIFEVIDPVR